MSTANTTPGADRLAATTTRLAGQGTGIDAADVDLLAAAGRDGVVWQHEGFGLAAEEGRPRSGTASDRPDGGQFLRSQAEAILAADFSPLTCSMARPPMY